MASFPCRYPLHSTSSSNRACRSPLGMLRGELVTPTGAAIVAALDAERKLPARFTVKQVGLGAGKRSLRGALHPSCNHHRGRGALAPGQHRAPRVRHRRCNWRAAGVCRRCAPRGWRSGGALGSGVHQEGEDRLGSCKSSHLQRMPSVSRESSLPKRERSASVAGFATAAFSGESRDRRKRRGGRCVRRSSRFQTAKRARSPSSTTVPLSQRSMASACEPSRTPSRRQENDRRSAPPSPSMSLSVCATWLPAAISSPTVLEFIYNLDKKTMDEMGADLDKEACRGIARSSHLLRGRTHSAAAESTAYSCRRQHHLSVLSGGCKGPCDKSRGGTVLSYGAILAWDSAGVCRFARIWGTSERGRRLAPLLLCRGERGRVAAFDEVVGKLGFGLNATAGVRARGEAAPVDVERVKTMVDAFLAAGFTYFDTAYVYHDGASERVAKEALVDRYPRESFTLATKMPGWLLKEPGDVGANLCRAARAHRCRVFRLLPHA